MSTILKSLKKLEQQKEANPYASSGSAYHGPGAMGLQEEKHGWIKAPWFKRSIVVVIIVGLGGSSLYFYNKSRTNNNNQIALNTPADDRQRPAVTAPDRQPKPTDPSPQRRRITENKPRATSPAPIPRQVEKGSAPETAPTRSTAPRVVQPPPPSDTGRAETPARGKSPVGPMARAQDAQPVQGTAEKSTRTGPPFSRPQKRVPQTQNPAQSSEPSRSPAKRVESKRPQPSSESYDNVSILRDGRLKVQAIVWSTISDDRMTVINDSVLHEGDSLDGFTVVSIRPDDVVVREGRGAKWKVLFGRP